jgi:photosystem II stability/assembly factor-like uncharacterized protein
MDKFNKLYLLLFVHCTLFIADCYSQWVQQTSGVTSHLLDCDFINQNTGWACGDGGRILKTTNGGINWVQQATGVNKRLEGIEAVDENILYSVGWFETILKSTNGGTSWIIIRDGPSGMGSSFFKTFFLNSNTGWMLHSGAGGGWILRTVNGGNSFDSVQINNSFPRDIFFKDALTGVLCANVAYVSRSTDGGVTWNQVPLPLFEFGAPNLYRLSFVGDYGWTIGEGGNQQLGRLVYRTTNFGISWDSIGRVPYPAGVLNYSVFFSNINIGWAGGTTGYIFKTTNGGFNWLQQVSPAIGFRNDFWFYNDSIGWSVGGGGQIFKTTNGGTYVGLQISNEIIPDKYILYQNYPNPFNNTTIIEFDIIEKNNYRLEVFDILGRKINELFSRNLQPGSYKYTYSPQELSTGVYIYRLSSSKYSITKKFMIIK